MSIESEFISAGNRISPEGLQSGHAPDAVRSFHCGVIYEWATQKEKDDLSPSEAMKATGCSDETAFGWGRTFARNGLSRILDKDGKFTFKWGGKP